MTTESHKSYLSRSSKLKRERLIHHPLSPAEAMQGLEAQERDCPICGAKRRHIPELVMSEGLVFFHGTPLPFSFTQNKIVTFLYQRLGRTQTYDALFNHIYGHDPRGGPLGFRNVLRTSMVKIRQGLDYHSVPLKIRAVASVGYVMIQLSEKNE